MLARMSTRVGDAVWVDNAARMDDRARKLWVWLAAGEAVGWEVTVEATDYEGRRMSKVAACWAHRWAWEVSR